MKINQKKLKQIQKLPFHLKVILFIVFVCIGSFSFLNSFSNDFYVKRVIDGDTIVVHKNNKSIKIRLYGIDAPESKQRYGEFCTKQLKSLINNQKITLYIHDKDKYDRTIATIFKDGVDINQQMVRNGCAWAYTYFTKKYKNDELYARANKIGLWQDKKPINPYIWRKNHKHQKGK